MRFKTFKAIFVTVAVCFSFSFIFLEKHFIPYLLPSDVPVWYEFFPLKNLLILGASLSGVMFFLKATISVKSDCIMTKKAYFIYIIFLAVLIAFPLIFYPSRTEITSEAITRHNIFGQISEVYRVEDAEKVTAELKATGSSGRRTMPKTYLNFTYEIQFKDGRVYTLEDRDDDLWWTIIDKIDRVITENKTEKKVLGKSLDEIIYQFDNAYDVIRHRDEVLSIMNR